LKTKLSFLIGDMDKGGQERQLFYLLSSINKSQYQIQLHVWDFSTEDFYFPQLPLEIEVVKHRPRANSQIKLFKFIAKTILFQPQVIHSYAFYLNRVAALGTKVVLGKSKSIGALRSSFAFMQRTRSEKLLLSNYSSPDLIHSNNRKSAEELAAFLTSHSKQKTTRVLPNALDTPKFSPRLDFNPDGVIRSISVGRLIKSKEFDAQIKIIKVLRDKGHNIEHTIVGYGDEEQSLRRAIELTSLHEFVMLRTEVTDPAHLYRESDIFIQTSSTEGLPNCVMEAMSCGLCCFATDVGDTSVLIESEKTGFTFNNYDYEAITSKIHETIQNGGKQLFYIIGKSASSFINENFSMVSNLRNIESMYNEQLK
jgi:glycosyltransferase involved in cell wall biosynthesis